MENNTDKKNKILKGASYIGAAGVGAMAQKAFSSNGNTADDVIDANIESTADAVEEMPVEEVERPIHAGIAAVPESFVDNADIVDNPEPIHTTINININTGDHAQPSPNYAETNSTSAFAFAEASDGSSSSFAEAHASSQTFVHAEPVAPEPIEPQPVAIEPQPVVIEPQPIVSEPIIHEPIIAEPETQPTTNISEIPAEPLYVRDEQPMDVAPEPKVVHTPIAHDPEPSNTNINQHIEQPINYTPGTSGMAGSSTGSNSPVTVADTGDELHGNGSVIGNHNTMVNGTVVNGNIYNGPVTIVQNSEIGNTTNMNSGNSQSTSYNNSGNNIDNSNNSINNSGNTDIHDETSWHNEEHQTGQFAGHDIDSSSHIEPAIASDTPFDDSHDGLFTNTINPITCYGDPSAVPDHMMYDMNDLDSMGGMGDMNDLSDMGGFDDIGDMMV